MTFTAVYERGDQDWWVASCPEVPGAITQGKTLEEARWMLKDAIRELQAARREKALQRIQNKGHEVISEPLEL